MLLQNFRRRFIVAVFVSIGLITLASIAHLNLQLLLHKGTEAPASSAFIRSFRDVQKADALTLGTDAPVLQAAKNVGADELGTLTCRGSPVKSEVIYWRVISADREFESPFRDPDHEKFVVFQYDQAGWNNLRMAFEVLVVAAHAMGRTLVLPPRTTATYTARNSGNGISIEDFYDLRPLDLYKGWRSSTMNEFLVRHNKSSLVGEPWEYISNISDAQPAWFDKVVVFDLDSKFKHPSFRSKLVLEAFKHQREASFYDTFLQEAELIYFPSRQETPHRILEHFYSFIFFSTPEQQSFYKRFVRDTLRYQDEIQCAGSDIIGRIRSEARALQNSTSERDYFALHIRRGDFFYAKTRQSASEIIANVGDLIPRGSLVYISTDDPKGVCEGCTQSATYSKNGKIIWGGACPKGAAARGLQGCLEDPSWDAFRSAGWEIRFLGDYMKQGAVTTIHPQKFGMVESVVCSRAKLFVGTYYSTFSGYIHRLRGYHGLGDGTYYHTPGFREAARSEQSAFGHGFMQEYQYGWSDDQGGLI